MKSIYNNLQSSGVKNSQQLNSQISALQSQLAQKANQSHTHSIADVTNLQTTLNGKAATSHTHVIADVTNLQAELNGKAASAHTHAIAEITNLQNELNGKAATSHTHNISDVTNLQTTLNGKAPTSHTHTVSDVTDFNNFYVGDGTLTGARTVDCNSNNLIYNNIDVYTRTAAGSQVITSTNGNITFTSTNGANTNQILMESSGIALSPSNGSVAIRGNYASDIHLNVGNGAISGRSAARFRCGESNGPAYNTVPTLNQIKLSFDNTNNFNHHIFSQHDAGFTHMKNNISFAIWDNNSLQPSDDPNRVHFVISDFIAAPQYTTDNKLQNTGGTGLATNMLGTDANGKIVQTPLTSDTKSFTISFGGSLLGPPPQYLQPNGTPGATVYGGTSALTFTGIPVDCELKYVGYYTQSASTAQIQIYKNSSAVQFFNLNGTTKGSYAVPGSFSFNAGDDVSIAYFSFGTAHPLDSTFNLVFEY